MSKNVMKTGDIISIPRYRVVTGKITAEVILASATIVKIGRKWITVVFENGEKGLIEKTYDKTK